MSQAARADRELLAEPVDETSLMSILAMQQGALETLHKQLDRLRNKLGPILMDEDKVMPHGERRTPVFRSEAGRRTVEAYEMITAAEDKVNHLIYGVNL